MSASAMVVAGWSLHLPETDLSGPVAAHLTGRPAAWAGAAQAASCPPDKASVLLGRRGLLYKEPATRLALCAVHRALGLPAGHRPDGPPDPGTAVVVAGNLGNVATVAEVVRTVAAEGGRGVSPLAAPNASSNVVASTVALWFRFGGPNLMVCSGATAGLDAVWLAGLLLRAGRAERVVVVGAEPADETAAAIHGAAGSGVPLRAGAACLVLRAAGDDPVPRAGRDTGSPAPRVLLAVDGGVRRHAPARGTGPSTAARRVIGPGGFDPVDHWGDHHGAHGVVGVALAAHLVADEGAGAVEVRCGDPSDGWRAATVTAGRVPGVNAATAEAKAKAAARATIAAGVAGAARRAPAHPPVSAGGGRP